MEVIDQEYLAKVGALRGDLNGWMNGWRVGEGEKEEGENGTERTAFDRSFVTLIFSPAFGAHSPFSCSSFSYSAMMGCSCATARVEPNIPE
jgi:hypothetical protein